MTLDEFVCRVQRAYSTPMSQAVFAENSWSSRDSFGVATHASVHLWSNISSAVVDMYFSRATYVAVIWPDGSAQLLSRDEAECRLFTTLWELGR